MSEHTISHDIADAGGGSYQSMYADSTAALEHLLKVGELVYIDSIGGGLVPAKIIEIEPYAGDPKARRLDSIISGRITVQVTAARPGYKRGDKVSCLPSAVVARRAVFTRNRKYRIIQLNYAYEVGP